MPGYAPALKVYKELLLQRMVPMSFLQADFTVQGPVSFFQIVELLFIASIPDHKICLILCYGTKRVLYFKLLLQT